MLEAFRALNALNEDIFSLDAEGVDKLSNFTQNDDLEDDVQIIDPEAETEDDLQDNYIGKVILDCCVCHSKLYKDPSEVNIDETGELANIGEECPYCFTPDGFKVIGEVAAFSGNEQEDETEEVTETDDEPENNTEEEVVEENLKEGLVGDINVPITANVDASGSSVGFLGGTSGDIANENLEEEPIEEGIFNFGKKKKLAAEQARREREEREREEQEDAERRERERGARIARGWKEYEERERQAKRDYERSRYNSIKGDRPSNTGYRGVNYSGGDYYESLEEGIFDKKSSFSTDNVKEVRPSEVKKGDILALYVFNDDDGPYGDLNKAAYGKVSDIEVTPSEQEGGATKYEFEAIVVSSGAKGDRVGMRALWPVLDYCNVFVVANTGSSSKKSESLDESIEDLSMTANDTHVEVSEEDNGKVTVTMEPVTKDNGEMIAPVSPETEAEIMADEGIDDLGLDAESEIDAEFDEFDEESMDSLGESYFKKVYENVNSFKTTSVKTSGNSMIIEGLLEFDSGNKKTTSFIFEALDATKHGKFRFVGDNKELTEGKKAFMLTGTIKNNKLIVESMNYNYKHVDAEGKASRVYGTERIK